jgi:hypothetical protein
LTCNGYNPRHPAEPVLGGYCFVVGGFVHAYAPAPPCYTPKGGVLEGPQKEIDAQQKLF